MCQARLEEVVRSGPLSVAVPNQSQGRGESSPTKEQGNIAERREVEETVHNTDVDEVDEEEAGLRATEARIAKQRVERARREKERKQGGDMTTIVFSDDGWRGPGTGTAVRGLPPLQDNNDLPATIEVPSTARGEPMDEHQ
jgi:hypothetical protein